MKELIIVGASGFGREIIEYIEDINDASPQWIIKGFLDDNINALDDFPSDYKIIGRIVDWQPSQNEVFVCALAFPDIKKKIVNELRGRGAEFISIIHPSARISRHATIGEGVVITPNSNVNTNAVVGDFVSILGSGIGHDAKIGSFSTFSGRCSVNGHVEVGECVYAGCGVFIAPSKTIGDHATLGIGSVVISNVKSNTKVFGNPAKKLAF